MITITSPDGGLTSVVTITLDTTKLTQTAQTVKAAAKDGFNQQELVNNWLRGVLQLASDTIRQSAQAAVKTDAQIDQEAQQAADQATAALAAATAQAAATKALKPLSSVDPAP